MAAFQRGLPADLINLHSSHPAPLSAQQLAHITRLDFAAISHALSQDYAPVIGGEELRRAIVTAHYEVIDHDDILTTCGAQEALFITMQALLQQGDHVVCLTPIFEPLYQQAKMAGAQVETVPLLADSQWTIDWPALRQAVTDSTRLVIINFLHNPIGCHISDKELTDLVNLCHQHDCWLLSDEVFRGLEHQTKTRLPAAVDCYDKAISIAVMSKAYGMPALRLGWIACRQQQMRDRIITVKRHLSICGSRLDETVAQQLLPHSAKIFNHHRQQLSKNRRQLADSLQYLPHLQVHLPAAGATCFVRLQANQKAAAVTGDDFARQLARQQGLLVLPNSCFITDTPGFRLSIADAAMADHYPQLMIDP